MKKGTRWTKQMFALLLAGILLETSVNLSTWTVYAAETEEIGSQQEKMALESGVVYCSSQEVYAIAEERLGSMNPAEGNHEKYIDRVDLSENAKLVYTTLENSTEALIDPAANITPTSITYKSGAYNNYYLSSTVTASSEEECKEKMQEVMTAYAAFMRDHPEVFWLNGTVAVDYTSYSNGTFEIRLIIRQVKTSGEVTSDVRSLDTYPDEPGNSSASKIRATITARDAAVNAILNGVQSEWSAYQKVSYFNEWLTKNNCYNSYAASADESARKSCLQAWQCVSALSAADPAGTGTVIGTKSPVCEGYAKAFKILCDKVGIPCVLVGGTGISSATSGAHMWNYTKVDGAWYGVDVTWNDPVVSGEGNSETSGHEGVSYLLVGKNTQIGDRTFGASHIEDNHVFSGGATFTGGPEISDDKYVENIKADTIITVDESSKNYTKTYGDADFTLSGISNSVNAPMTYQSNNEKIVTVDNTGCIHIVGAGSTTITVAVEETNTYKSAIATINVTVAAAEPSVRPDSTMSTAYDKKDKTVGDVTGLPSDWNWASDDASKKLQPNVGVTATAVYKNDAQNYKTVEVTITMQSCEHITKSEKIDTPATCKSTGRKHEECQICGHVFDSVEIPKTGHSNTGLRNQLAATCTTEGYTGDTYCNDCNTKLSTGTSIAALGHTGGTATCSEQAVCDRCHRSYGDKNASNHVGSKVTGQKEATCTENGYTGDKKCTGCAVVLEKGQNIPALGHRYNSTITREPTTDLEGLRTYICSRCGASYTEKIEKLPKEMGLTDGTWKLDGGKWWYAAADGSYPSNGWTLVEGEWYAFDASGYMQTGWYQDGGSWYYLNSLGVMQTGWVGDGGTWYYMKDSGAMATGWVQDGNDWYYMNSNGVMCTGWKEIGGTWYYFQTSGVMSTGWQQIDGIWYYFREGGAMQTGWQKLDGVWYYFEQSGTMCSGWQMIGSTWYYFYSSGAMAADTVIDGYRLGSSGAMY